ncbi:hypothetical protein GCM10022397_11720 [Flavivirga jejuensis]
MDIIIKKLVEIQTLGFDWGIDQRNGQITFRIMKQDCNGTVIVEYTSTVFCKYASDDSVEYRSYSSDAYNAAVSDEFKEVLRDRYKKI